MSKDTIRLTVENMVSWREDHEVPRFCPICRVDLRGPDALIHHGRALVAWKVDLSQGSILWSHTSETLEEGCFPKAWFCQHCGHELCTSKETQVPPTVDIPPVGTEERNALVDRFSDAGSEILTALAGLPSLRAINHTIGRLARGWGFDDASVAWAEWRKTQPGELSKEEKRLMLLAKWRVEWEDDELDDFPDDPEEGE